MSPPTAPTPLLHSILLKHRRHHPGRPGRYRLPPGVPRTDELLGASAPRPRRPGSPQEVRSLISSFVRSFPGWPGRKRSGRPAFCGTRTPTTAHHHATDSSAKRSPTPPAAMTTACRCSTAGAGDANNKPRRLRRDQSFRNEAARRQVDRRRRHWSRFLASLNFVENTYGSITAFGGPGVPEPMSLGAAPPRPRRPRGCARPLKTLSVFFLAVSSETVGPPCFFCLTFCNPPTFFGPRQNECVPTSDV